MGIFAGSRRQRGGGRERPKRLINCFCRVARNATLPYRDEWMNGCWHGNSFYYRICDRLTEAVIYFMVIFSPWAFGSTQPWAVAVMNCAGSLLGLLLVGKWVIRRLSGYRPARWGERGGG